MSDLQGVAAWQTNRAHGTIKRMNIKRGPLAWGMYVVLRAAFAVMQALKRININRGPLAWVFYVVLRAAFAVMQAFPINWNLRTARLLARLWAWIRPRHLRRAVEHLRAAFGESLSAEQAERIAFRSLESVAMFAVETVCLPRLITRHTWNRYIHTDGYDEFLRLMIEGKGLIMVTGHYGSFELMGHLLTALGFRMAAVMRPLDNKYLNDFLVRSRRRHGLRLLDKKGAMAEAESVIRAGYLLGFIGDQDAGRKGMYVDFFGQPASTYKSIGLLAMATERPIVVGYARRRGHIAEYDFVVQRIIHPHEWATQDDPLRWITQTYTRAIEDFVREAPEQYWWLHRRWKSKPRTAGRRKESRLPTSAQLPVSSISPHA